MIAFLIIFFVCVILFRRIVSNIISPMDDLYMQMNNYGKIEASVMFDIMIVDDDEILLYGLEKTIDWAAMDCRIVAKCTDSDEAIEKFKKIRPRIIITDICMPGITGFH